MAERLQSLQDNLDFEKTRYEQRNEREKFAVIPVKERFKSQNNKDKNPFNYLVVALDQHATITKGNLIQFVPEGERTPAPLHTFTKIYTHQKLETSGTFTVLSVTDDFRYELKFEQGKLKELTERKRKTVSSTGRTTGCTDWYLQTWAVWEDGSMTLISEVYINTTCDGDCWQPRIINGRNYRADCSGSNGGGDIDYDIEFFRQLNWWVWEQGCLVKWGVNALDKLKGKRSPVPGGGYFTKVENLSADCIDCASHGATWNWTGATEGGVGTSVGTVRITGTVFYSGISYPIDKTKSWTFNEVFP